MQHTFLNLQAFHPKAEYGGLIGQVFWLVPIYLPSHTLSRAVAVVVHLFSIIK